MSPERLDDDLGAQLRPAEAPRQPSDHFRHRLRAELLGDTDAPLDTDPLSVGEPPSARSHPGSVRRASKVVAAAAVVVAVLGSFAWLGGADRGTEVFTDPGPSSSSVTTTTVTPASFDLDAARRACERFAVTSFDSRDRLQVVGPNNGAHLTTQEELVQAATALAAAVEQLEAELVAAGVWSADFERHAGRLSARVEAASQAASSGQRSAALAQLNGAEELLIALDATLTAKGIPQCF